MQHYRYPHIIEFLDSITNIVLILAVPLLIVGILYLFALIFSISKRDNKVVDTVFIFIALILLGGYSYYAFFVLNYFSLFSSALFSLLIIVMYVVFSPFILVYIILTSTDIEQSLFLNSGSVLQDIHTWLHLKFGIDINEITKESLLVSFKLLTLVLFSTKIINVTRFIISSLTHTHSRRDSIAAFTLFGVVFGLYVFLNIEELSKLFSLVGHISNTLIEGEML